VTETNHELLIVDDLRRVRQRASNGYGGRSDAAIPLTLAVGGIEVGPARERVRVADTPDVVVGLVLDGECGDEYVDVLRIRPLVRTEEAAAEQRNCQANHVRLVVVVAIAQRDGGRQ